MQMIENHFSKNYYRYDFDDICKLTKVIGYNYLKSSEILNLIEDNLKIRICS